MRELIILLKDREDTNADTPIAVFDTIEAAKEYLESDYRDNPGYRFEERFSGHYTVNRIRPDGSVMWSDRYSTEIIAYHQN